ncbi:CHAP domain-containing protein [Mycobacterium sp. NPDC006124]|uniref:CHAP domain-containing protein n=1 Tax=Mycobacterium sp. NPDC006124 TaxID=3156729 RepID=UPI0033B5DBE8
MSDLESHEHRTTTPRPRDFRVTVRRSLAALAVALFASALGAQAVDVAPPSSADTVDQFTVRTVGLTQSVNPGTPGQCTWGAAQKWFEATGSYPAMRGDAWNWVNAARAAGYTVVDAPTERSIVVFQPGAAGAGGYGHVAWVDSVTSQAGGQWIHVTEMNGLAGEGLWNDRDVQNVPGMAYVLLP